MTRRTSALLSGALLLMAFAAIAMLLPLPYVALLPGPTADTLGSSGGKALITVKGEPTYPSKGGLRLTTVRVLGGPGRPIDLLTVLRGWVDPTIAVVPEERVYPKGRTPEEVEQQNAEDMELSQQSAKTAALRHLGYAVTSQVAVRSIVEGAPALDRLKAGDEIVTVDGKAVTSPEQVAAAVRAHRPGEVVRFTVVRDKARREVTVPTRAAPDEPARAVVGIVPATVAKYPFTIDFHLEEVGGPSAGLMFSLGLVDKLTPEDLTGGLKIAGTGTIDDDGAVGPIGGIQQKLVAARKVGATAFLVPADNCASAVAVAPRGLRLVKVDDLDGALDALAALRTGKGHVPSCAA